MVLMTELIPIETASVLCVNSIALESLCGLFMATNLLGIRWLIYPLERMGMFGVIGCYTFEAVRMLSIG